MLLEYYEFEKMIDEAQPESVNISKEKSKWIIRLEIDKESMLDKNITMEDINFAISNSYNDEITSVYSDYNSDNLVFRLRVDNLLGNKKKNKQNPLDQSDEIYLLRNFQDQLLNNIILRGVKNIKKINLRKITDDVYNDEGTYKNRDIWVLDTIGTNLMEVLALDNIDVNKTFSNDIQEIYRVFGIEAARNAIYNEVLEVLEHDNVYINSHHLSVLCDRMTYIYKMISIFRHGINNDDIGPIAKASFEETPEQFLKAARHAEVDFMRGVSSNVMCGQQGYFGTSSFQVMVDMTKAIEFEKVSLELEDEDELIDNIIGGVDSKQEYCSADNINMNNNASVIKPIELGKDDDYDLDI